MTENKELNINQQLLEITKDMINNEFKLYATEDEVKSIMTNDEFEKIFRMSIRCLPKNSKLKNSIPDEKIIKEHFEIYKQKPQKTHLNFLEKCLASIYMTYKIFTIKKGARINDN